MSVTLPSKGDPLNLPSGWTLLRQNHIYGLRVAKSFSSLMSFCSPSYFPANNCCFAVSRSTLPYFLQSSVLPVLSHNSPPKILLSMPAPGPYSSVLSFTSLYPFLPCTSFPSCISLSCTSLRSHTSHVCHALPLPKSCLECSLQVPPPAYFLLFLFIFLSRTSLYCGFYL